MRSKRKKSFTRARHAVPYKRKDVSVPVLKKHIDMAIAMMYTVISNCY
jgi:hypothetical protein